jgi:hypothetical protein
MRAHLRWVTSGETGIKVRVETKAKVGPSVTASVSNLEIDFPVWVQVHLQVIPHAYFAGGQRSVYASFYRCMITLFVRICHISIWQKGLTNPATKFQLAATGEPKIRFRVALGKFR